eukprot:3756530-Rhodomonas_salina.1
MSGTEIMHVLREVRYWASVCCYAMSGTELADSHGSGPLPIILRACYAMSGTDLANGALRLQMCYAMSGTDLAYTSLV